jgi:hypothetical protein
VEMARNECPGHFVVEAYLAVLVFTSVYARFRERTLEHNAGWVPMVAIIDLARGQGTNPEVPTWLKNDYFQAIQELASLGVAEYPRTKSPEDVRAILSILALAKGARTLALVFVNYSDDELADLESPS